ncbi:MAG: type I DNA topoisomerase [Candidatus Nealsonbacteria bacterium]|nr:type I DNA topoisomerase [Candidatus Nealsonbacteria bacterium]
MKLIIVESPTKSKTLQSFLGKDYKVLSSFGHVRDLPKGSLGVDLENNFKPKYVIPTKSRKTVTALKKELPKSDSVVLATDEDREGEAIAWHLAQALDLSGQKKYERIAFHEITKPAILEALKNPREIDMNLVNAQQARRVLDRIVGYKLSPFLWKKIARGLSAGRVQSIAVRLVVEREREIKKFQSQEYWSIIALLIAEDSPRQFETILYKKNGEAIDKLAIKNTEEAEAIISELRGAEYKVENIEKKESRRNPLPPFTTSTLQQDAWRKFKFPAKFTMRIAQNLYERGFITYHRTDSLNLSGLALGAAKELITERYGQNYHQFRKYKSKGRAQEAHEAIRPTNADRPPKNLDENQRRLYELIWQRFIACQMAPAVFDAVAIDIAAQNYTFRANGQTLKFDGFLKAYPIKYEETDLPLLEKEEILELKKLVTSQHFTQPPARYTEATLIKALEAEGIGRPSTYAPTLSTIQDRNYIEKNEKRYFQPTEIGTVVNDLLVEHFPQIVDIKFTANMEDALDKIAEGEAEWTKIIGEFYGPFAENLEKKYEEVSKKDFTEKPTGKTCPKCGSPLIMRLGKFGQFYACSKFPDCKYTESLPQKNLNVKCPKCLEGDLVEKRTKRKKIFYGCNRFPKCDFALWDKPTGEKCQKCGSLLVEKQKKIKCSNKECDYQKDK